MTYFFYDLCKIYADALFYKVTIGQRQGLSPIDAQQADLLYQRECASRREAGGLLSGTLYKQRKYFSLQFLCYQQEGKRSC